MPSTVAKFFLAISIVLLLCSRASAEVRCTCPTIPADGHGGTTCTGSEENNRCSLTYNQFPPDLVDSGVNLLRNATGRGIEAPNPALSNSFSELYTQLLKDMGTAETSQILIDAIQVYLAIAVVVQGENIASDEMAEHMRSIVSAVEENRALVGSVFNFDAADLWMGVPDERLPDPPQNFSAKEGVAGLRAAPGCVEIRAKTGIWVMFKINWSPTRLSPRCEVTEQ